MVVDLVVPEEGLVPIAEGEVLNTDVLIGVLGTLLERGHMLPVLPVLVPKVVSIDTAENQAGDDSIDGELAPKVAGGSSMVLDSSSLAVERIVNHPRKLVVGAVEAALESSASRSATQLLSGAEDVALREHGAEGQSNGCCVFLQIGRAHV